MPTTRAERLTCAKIADLDNGIFGVVVDDDIRRICSDLDERGHDGQVRSLTLKIEFKLNTERGEPVIEIDPRVEAKFPPHRAGVTKARVAPDQKTGEFGMLFQAMNAENPDQPSLIDEDEK